jgi:predicted pyridoxine 5'-phosphate oxidase superfamily flavin-nucleotide-binding protein
MPLLRWSEKARAVQHCGAGTFFGRIGARRRLLFVSCLVKLWVKGHEAFPRGRKATASMGVLTTDMKRVVEEQRLGFVATVCPDGTPNLSPKGTTAVWDEDHLVFANIRSPGTLANLRTNPNVEVNVVDPVVRKGYRFKGVASVLESGDVYERAIEFYKERGAPPDIIREIVLIRVHSAQPVTSPAYDLGLSEDEVRTRWLLRMGLTPVSKENFLR